MSEKNIHIIRGNDTFSIELHIANILKKLGADFDASMNLSRPDGKVVTQEELSLAVTSLPFFGSNRMVVVTNASTLLEKQQAEKTAKLLNSIPDTTHLVLIVEDRLKWRKDDQGKWQQYWEILNPEHWLAKNAVERQALEFLDSPLPDERDMPAWVMREAKRQGGQFSPDAGAELSRHTGSDTGIASQEIAKLLIYVNFERAVSVADVVECVSVEGSADTFKMLDMLMSGNKKEAQAMMHQLLDDTQPEMILGALAHRFRQMIQVRAALDDGEDVSALAKSRIIFSNQVNAYTQAAQRYPMERLKEIFSRLLQMDVQSKLWEDFPRLDEIQVDLKTNLELFVMEA
jgi:DNA polymerase-3 subunit delta